MFILEWFICFDTPCFLLWLICDVCSTKILFSIDLRISNCRLDLKNHSIQMAWATAPVFYFTLQSHLNFMKTPRTSFRWSIVLHCSLAHHQDWAASIMGVWYVNLSSANNWPDGTPFKLLGRAFATDVFFVHIYNSNQQGILFRNKIEEVFCGLPNFHARDKLLRQYVLLVSVIGLSVKFRVSQLDQTTNFGSFANIRG